MDAKDNADDKNLMANETVSLPSIEINTIQQPVILQVFSSLNAIEAREQNEEIPIHLVEEPPQTYNNTNLVSSCNNRTLLSANTTLDESTSIDAIATIHGNANESQHIQASNAYQYNGNKQSNSADVNETTSELDIEKETLPSTAAAKVLISNSSLKNIIEDFEFIDASDSSTTIGDRYRQSSVNDVCLSEADDADEIHLRNEKDDSKHLEHSGNSIDCHLSQVVDLQLSEVTNILKTQDTDASKGIENSKTGLNLIAIPSPTTLKEAEERKLYINSLPPLQTDHSFNNQKIISDCKADKPPIPIKTYRWEDLRRAKERGGYPWTHLYKRRLGPDEEPEIVLLLRKSQELHGNLDSPKSQKKVRIDEQVLVKETYDNNSSHQEPAVFNHNHHNQQHISIPANAEDLVDHRIVSKENFFCASDSALATRINKKSQRLLNVRDLFKRGYRKRPNEDNQSLPDTLRAISRQHSLEVPTALHPTKYSEEFVYETPKKLRCFPLIEKLKTMAERQKKRLNIKRIHLDDDKRIEFNEQPHILKLKDSPKSQRSDIPHFIEKQNSDDVLEIIELDESPSRKRLDDGRREADISMNGELNGGATFTGDQNNKLTSIEIKQISDIILQTDHMTNDVENQAHTKDAHRSDPTVSTVPKRIRRQRREHVYEEIEQTESSPTEALNFILDATSVEALKQSLTIQDSSAIKEVATANNKIPLDRMGSSEEEQIQLPHQNSIETAPNGCRLAPISSFDSTSSDDDRNRPHLQPLIEEETEQNEQQNSIQLVVAPAEQRKPSSIKRDASPVSSEKKVTFSYVEDEADPHREDIELSPEHMEATKQALKKKQTLL